MYIGLHARVLFKQKSVSLVQLVTPVTKCVTPVTEDSPRDQVSGISVTPVTRVCHARD